MQAAGLPSAIAAPRRCAVADGRRGRVQVQPVHASASPGLRWPNNQPANGPQGRPLARPSRLAASPRHGDSSRRRKQACYAATEGAGPGGGEGKPPAGGGGGGDGGDGDDDGKDRLLELEEATRLAGKAGVELPADFVIAAQEGGLRLSALKGWAALSGSTFSLLLAKLFGNGVRDRMIADPRFLFKLWVEILIDTGCCTIAEVRKRGEKFWDEVEFYISDVLVGVVLDAAMVSMLAPVAIVGALPKRIATTGIIGALRRYSARLPASMFERAVPGVREFSKVDRAMCVVVKFFEYSLIGMACGALGQTMANQLKGLTDKIKGKTGAEEAGSGGHGHGEKTPPILQTALVWGLFMGASSNTRYQVVVGLERVVESTVGKSLPLVNNLATVGIRFANNVIGGENFIDMARYFGVQ
ncbi:unnamed protein product [Pedinophyceae sp. YPF-701]|nr:unnamed protein product [Pedinophyceae sp. YPF-701]